MILLLLAVFFVAAWLSCLLVALKLHEAGYRIDDHDPKEDE